MMNIKKTLVSIVTVVLNDKEFLKKTIESTINQDYTELEIIIIDGGSKDGTLELIESYSSRIDCWLSEPDKGIYDAMNKGVKLASGKWINFFNAGDTFFNNRVISDVFRIATDTDDLVYGNTVFLSNNKEELISAKGTDTLWQAINFNHNSLFCKRELLLKHPFDLAYRIVSDSEFVMWCYTNGKRFLNTGLTINNYQRGGYADQNSIMRTVERWKLVTDYQLKDQDEINSYYFQRLLWEDFYKIFLKNNYNFSIKT